MLIAVMENKIVGLTLFPIQQSTSLYYVSPTSPVMCENSLCLTTYAYMYCILIASLCHTLYAVSRGYRERTLN